MPADYLHNHRQFADLIRIVAQAQGIDPALVEKDYWIMHSLYGLQQLGLKFELKGGTSLSKGHQVINRFSEDIDILIEPPPELHVKIGRNHTKLRHVESRKIGSRRPFASMASTRSSGTRPLTTSTTSAAASGCPTRALQSRSKG
jgi:predicted nucleotidyltransferase component of viral defense system